MRVRPSGLTRGLAVYLVALAFLASVTPAAAQPVESPGNVIIVILDDVSVDDLPIYAGYPLAGVCGTECDCTSPATECPSCDCAVNPPFDLPTLDTFIGPLAQTGVVFKNTYSDPSCSPTRATMQTGLYGFRTGVGLAGNGFGPFEPTIPKALAAHRSLHPESPAYSTAAIGKWHLPRCLVCDSQKFVGFDFFSGTEGNLGDIGSDGYCDWKKTLFDASTDFCGTEQRTTYATTDNVDDAIRWICRQSECGDGFCKGGETVGTCPADCETVVVSCEPPCDPEVQYDCGNEECDQAETFLNCPGDCDETVCGSNGCERGERYCTNCPQDCAADADPACSPATARRNWFLWLALNAPHGPYEVACGGADCDPTGSGAARACGRVDDDEATTARRMLEIVDCELGRLQNALENAQLWDDTTVILVGDNGSTGISHWNANHDKTTVYEGGVRVPLIVGGKNVASGEGPRFSEALVNTTDLFSTALELMGVDVDEALPGVTLDSESLVPILEDDNYDPQASIRETAYVEQFGGSCSGQWERAIRDHQFKLIRRCPACEQPASCCFSDAGCTEELYSVADVLECCNLATDSDYDDEREDLGILLDNLATDIECSAGEPCRGCCGDGECAGNDTCAQNTHKCCPGPVDDSGIVVQWTGPQGNPSKGTDYIVQNWMVDEETCLPWVVLKTASKNGEDQVLQYRVGRFDGDDPMPLGAVTTTWSSPPFDNITVRVGVPDSLKLGHIVTVDIDAEAVGKYSSDQLNVTGDVLNRVEVCPAETAGGRVAGDVSGLLQHGRAYAIGRQDVTADTLRVGELGGSLALATIGTGSRLEVTGFGESAGSLVIAGDIDRPVDIRGTFSGTLCAPNLLDSNGAPTIPESLIVAFDPDGSGKICRNPPVCEGSSPECYFLSDTSAVADPEWDEIKKSRYISFTVPSGSIAIRIMPISILPDVPNQADYRAFEVGQCTALNESNGCVRWVHAYRDGGNQVILDCSDEVTDPFKCATVACAPEYVDWGGGTLHVTGEAIIPKSVYEIQFIRAGDRRGSGIEQAETAAWGDIVGDEGLPNGTANVLDLAEVIDAVATPTTALPLPRVNLFLGKSVHTAPDPVNVLDISDVVEAVKELPYKYNPPTCE